MDKDSIKISRNVATLLEEILKTFRDEVNLHEEMVKTSRHKTNLLEEMVELLRTPPELPLSDVDLKSETPNNRMEIRKNAGHRQGQRPLSDLASRLSTLGKENAEAEIQSLTLEAIRQLASHLDIRIPSRATKLETIKMLLEQVFDVPAGHERIRTFHERNVLS